MSEDNPIAATRRLARTIELQQERMIESIQGRIAALEAENEALREDKALLDKLINSRMLPDWIVDDAIEEAAAHEDEHDLDDLAYWIRRTIRKALDEEECSKATSHADVDWRKLDAALCERFNIATGTHVSEQPLLLMNTIEASGYEWTCEFVRTATGTATKATVKGDKGLFKFACDTEPSRAVALAAALAFDIEIPYKQP